MSDNYWVIVILGVASFLIFTRGAATRDQTYSFVGHGLTALTCLIALGVGLGYGPAWLWVAAAAAFVVNFVWLVVRIRHA
jgi:hypothetical protein